MVNQSQGSHVAFREHWMSELWDFRYKRAYRGERSVSRVPSQQLHDASTKFLYIGQSLQPYVDPAARFRTRHLKRHVTDLVQHIDEKSQKQQTSQDGQDDDPERNWVFNIRLVPNHWCHHLWTRAVLQHQAELFQHDFTSCPSLKQCKRGWKLTGYLLASTGEMFGQDRVRHLPHFVRGLALQHVLLVSSLRG